MKWAALGALLRRTLRAQRDALAAELAPEAVEAAIGRMWAALRSQERRYQVKARLARRLDEVLVELGDPPARRRAAVPAP